MCVCLDCLMHIDSNTLVLLLSLFLKRFGRSVVQNQTAYILQFIYLQPLKLEWKYNV